MRVGLDRVSLVAGLAVIALGLLLLLDQDGAIELSPGIVGSASAATVGAMLVAAGLRGEDR